MKYNYKTHGICARSIDVEIIDGIVTNVDFDGGCSGNAQGVAKLAIGKKANEVAELLKDIKCGKKETSCPAQLSKAIQEALNM